MIDYLHIATEGLPLDDVIEKLIARRFLERRDVKAIQGADGGYRPALDRKTKERLPFTKRDLRAHVAGERSYGHYLVTPKGKCRLFAYDIDLVSSYTPQPKPPEDNPEWQPTTWTPVGEEPISPREAFHSSGGELRQQLTTELRCVAEGLAARASRMLDVPTAIAFSGNKGLHVYGFTGTARAADIRSAALNILITYGVFQPTRGNNFFRHTALPRFGFPNVEIEVFPKQDSLDGKDLGNLMRLPLGIHRGTDAKAFFVDPLTDEDGLVEMDPVEALQEGIQWK